MNEKTINSENNKWGSVLLKGIEMGSIKHYERKNIFKFYHDYLNIFKF
jgi:hypothetical protein